MSAPALPEPPEAPRPAPVPLALRLDEVARAIGISRRAIERERSAGRFPKPDRQIGRMPLWRVETIRAYLFLLRPAKATIRPACSFSLR